MSWHFLQGDSQFLENNMGIHFCNRGKTCNWLTQTEKKKDRIPIDLTAVQISVALLVLVRVFWLASGFVVVQGLSGFFF